MEDERIVGGIPFPDDLLFHFFNKNTIITDEYIQDPVSQLKLYPKQSNSVKATAVNSCIPVSKTILTNTRKVRSLFKHKLSELNNFGYLWAGQNTSSPYATTGLYLTSGKSAYSFLWFGSVAGGCAINIGQLEDDNYYICTQTVGESNISMKMNKVTIVNNAIVVGSDINSTTTAKGTEELSGSCFGILSACYSNGSYNYASGNQMIYIEFLDENDNVLLSFNFSEGAGQQVFDVISGSAFAIYNITESVFWENKQDFSHYNFRYGFTLYQKSGSPDIRIPNKKDGSEITPASVPSGYSRIANYKECRQTFNQCENTFVLDDVDVEKITVSGITYKTNLNGDYALIGTHSGNLLYEKIGGDITTRMWKNDVEYGWNIGDFSDVAYFQETPTGDGVTSADFPYNATFVPTVFGTGDAVCTLTESSNLYNADPDFILFTENTGVAKQINIGTLDVDIGHNRGYMYINPNVQEKDFMLYGTNKTLTDDLKIIKYIGLGDEVVTDESGEVIYDENDHTILE